jgi:hypothetical protein
MDEQPDRTTNIIKLQLILNWNYGNPTRQQALLIIASDNVRAAVP